MPASGPRSRGARGHPRSCQGCQPWPRASAASGLVLATQNLGGITGRALVLDDRVRAVLERLEFEEQRPPGVAVEPTTGRFLFSVCAPQADCEVLEIGGGRGCSTIWLATAVRHLGGRVLSLERD